jgi:Tol biopolymer transport system component
MNMLSKKSPKQSLLELIDDESIVFIDATVPDYQSLVAGIPPRTQVVILQPNTDGVAQISNALQSGNYKSVHIVSHGSEGSLQLGASQLNLDNLAAYQQELQQWSKGLTDDADILLYGCNVASGETGKAFLQQLAQITGVDIAASDDLTGSTTLGGDWKLEFSTGVIESPLAFQLEVMQAYNSVLASAGDVIINEFSQGSDGAKEWIELLVVTDNFNLQGYKLVDGNGTLDITLSGSGFSSLKAGTIIVLYNGGDVDSQITPDLTYDPNNGDYVLQISSLNNSGSFAVTLNSGWNGTSAAFSNSSSSDKPSLQDASDNTIFTFPRFLTPSSGQSSYYEGGSGTDPTDSSNWSANVANAEATPGIGNNTDNTAWIDSLRGLIGTSDSDPSIINNTISVSPGKTVTITNAMLQVTDSDQTPTQLTYSITSLPTQGQLYFNGSPLNVGDTFTQADVNSGLLSYTNSSNQQGSDSFTFTIIDDSVIGNGIVSRVSVNADGTEGNNRSQSPSISADGRYVSFLSYASNLVSSDTNGKSDIFVQDLQTGNVTLVSVSTTGVQANGDSELRHSISADGRYVVFSSVASNLVSNDTNNTKDIFVRDLVLEETTRVSVDNAGNEGNGNSVYPSISADGRYVVFTSSASNLVSGDTNGKSDIFVYDTSSKQIKRLSVGISAEANGDSWSPSISADGNYVVFTSSASNLVSGDTNGQSDIFVYDLQNNQIERVSVDSSGNQGNVACDYGSLSADGQYVAFYSTSSNLVSSDTNNRGDVFVRDRNTNQTVLVSVDSQGNQGNGQSLYPTISSDGRYVVFTSYASNLVIDDTNNAADIFVRDLQLEQTIIVSTDALGNEGSVYSEYPSISANGRYVVYDTSSSNLVTGDTNKTNDIFISDIQINNIDGTATINIQPYTPLSVVINEIAWMGTKASSTNEWMELYNPTNASIDLSGWKIQDVDGNTIVIPTGKIIQAGGYFLLERSSDNVVQNITADLIYSPSLSLANSEETLTLTAPDGTVIDTANSNGGDWPAGAISGSERISMERTDPLAADSGSNWHTNDGVTINGIDANGNIIYGTPGAANSTPVTPVISITPVTGLTTTERGLQDETKFYVEINVIPTSDVTINLSIDNPNAATLSTTSLVFNSSNWNTPQEVILTGKNNTGISNNIVYNIITAPVVSSDTRYNGLDADDVTVTNIDSSNYILGTNNSDDFTSTSTIRREFIIGRNGDDIIFGNGGDDYLIGGDGSDTFVLASGAGTETIRDFNFSEDFIGLSGGLTQSALTFTQKINDTFVTDNNNQLLAILQRVSVSQLTNSNFKTLP